MYENEIVRLRNTVGELETELNTVRQLSQTPISSNPSEEYIRQIRQDYENEQIASVELAIAKH